MTARYKGLVGTDGEGVLRALPDGDTGAEEKYLDANYMQSLPRVRFVASGKYEEIKRPAVTEHPRWNPNREERARGVGMKREAFVEGIQHGHYEITDDETEAEAQRPRRPWEAS